MQKINPVDLSVPVLPLVIPTVFAEGESLLGAVAAATRANVLGSTQIILREAGLTVPRPGLVGHFLGDCAQRLAEHLGCGVEGIVERCHTRVGRDDGGAVVNWGSGTMRRHDVLLERRRISPQSLKKAGHHRMAWLCRHLPYCPESLELLIDRCGLCGADLRWFSAWGISKCESCRRTVEAVGSDFVAPDQAEPYRRFASLISPIPEVRRAARRHLACDLANLSQPHLIDLVTAMGMAFGTAATVPSRPKMRELDPVSRAAAIACGVRLVDDWPTRLRDAATARYDEAAHAPETRLSLLRAIRPLGETAAFGPEVAGLFAAALPEACGLSRRALGGLREPVVLARDVLLRASIDSKQLARIDAANLLPSIEIASGERRQRQYPEAQVALFVSRRRGSQPATCLAHRLGIPTYAVEQLACDGTVPWEDMPAVLIVDPTLRLVSDAADRFAAELEDVARPDDPGEKSIALWSMMRRQGGGAKPWGRALADIRDRTRPVWSSRDPGVANRPFTRRAMVRPEDFDDLAAGPLPAAMTTDMPLSAFMSQEDACELLNLSNRALRPVTQAGLLTFISGGKAHWVGKDDVLYLADQLITAAEIAPRFELRPCKVAAHMRGHPKIAPMAGGWSRPDFVGLYG